MARLVLVCAATLFAFLLLPTGEGIKCYHCIAPLGGECDDPTKTNNFIKECPAEFNTTCYIRNTTLLDGAGQIVRDCAPKNVCAEPRALDVNTTCTQCDKDLCNSSPYHMNHLQFFISIFSLLFAKLLL